MRAGQSKRGLGRGGQLAITLAAHHHRHGRGSSQPRRAGTGRRGETGKLEIGFYTLLSIGALCDILLAFTNQHPDVEVNIIEGSRSTLFSLLRRYAVVRVLLTPASPGATRAVAVRAGDVGNANGAESPPTIRQRKHFTGEFSAECDLHPFSVNLDKSLI
jgi:DNA-binding transcriptional LysR family regulator